MRKHFTQTAVILAAVSAIGLTACTQGSASACCYYQYFLFHSSFPLIFYCPPGHGDIYIPKQDGNPAAKGNTASGISCLRPENTPRGSDVDSGQYISV